MTRRLEIGAYVKLINTLISIAPYNGTSKLSMGAYKKVVGANTTGLCRQKEACEVLIPSVCSEIV